MRTVTVLMMALLLAGAACSKSQEDVRSTGDEAGADSSMDGCSHQQERDAAQREATDEVLAAIERGDLVVPDGSALSISYREPIDLTRAVTLIDTTQSVVGITAALYPYFDDTTFYPTWDSPVAMTSADVRSFQRSIATDLSDPLEGSEPPAMGEPPADLEEGDPPLGGRQEEPPTSEH